MFTGLVQCLGTVTHLKVLGEDLRLTVEAAGLVASFQLGASISVNGTCLTVIEYEAQQFSADISRETLRATNLGDLQVDSRVNLEASVTPASVLGGHLVMGHVDAVGEVSSLRTVGRSREMEMTMPAELARFVACKGSICVDGVSLTVNRVSSRDFSVNIVPHTWQHTTMQDYRIGTRVNLEVDVVARYIDRLMHADREAS